jgi:anti-sigma factor RsiW
MKTTTQSDQEPSDIEAMLPWYATGRIKPADKALIDKALASDPELARRLEIVREEVGAVADLHDKLPGASPRALNKIMAGIAAEPRQAPVLKRAKQGLLDWLGGTLQAFAPRTLALAACAAICVVALQTAMLSGLIGSPDGSARYGTASAPSTVATGSVVMVAFVPSATAADLTAFLKKFDASIVDGPRASGLFRIKVSNEKLSPAQLDAILAAMQREKAVVATAAAGN